MGKIQVRRTKSDRGVGIREMIKKEKSGNLLLFFLKAILFFAVLAIFAVGQRLFYGQTLYYFLGNFVVILLYMVTLYLISKVYNGFNYGNSSVQEIILSWVLCLIFANVFQYFLLSLRIADLLPIDGFLFIIGAQIAFVTPMSIFIDMLYYKKNPAKKTVIVFGNREKLHDYQTVISKQRRKFKINYAISKNEPVGSILDVVDEAESVFLLDVDEKTQEWLLEYCYLHNKHTYILPSFSNILINSATTLWLSNTPMFSLKIPEPDMGVLFIKRFMDIAISLIGILLSSVLMAAVWVIVRVYDRHPAIYKQTRVTRNGKHFTLYKFRSMRPDAEDDGVPRLTAIDDERITPVGRIIRKARIDELPQLFNVLSGSMSIVGPRPERPEIAKQYEEVYPNFGFRTKVKAGLTGFAQIYGRYSTAPEEKLFLDIMYIETFSILEDIKLMLQTIRVVFQTSSAEGIETGSNTALRK